MGTWTLGVSAASTSPGRVDTYGVDAASHALAHAWWDGTSWRRETLDGTLTSRPAAVVSGAGQTAVFVLGTGALLYQKTLG